MTNKSMASVPRELLKRWKSNMQGMGLQEMPAQIDAILATPAEDARAVEDEPLLIPEGYCVMPRRLTAQNGAKALLLGEFKVTFTRECPECCELEEPTEGCEVCDGEGEFAMHQMISWDQIKYIYSKAVAGLALKPKTGTTTSP